MTSRLYRVYHRGLVQGRWIAWLSGPDAGSTSCSEDDFESVMAYDAKDAEMQSRQRGRSVWRVEPADIPPLFCEDE